MQTRIPLNEISSIRVIACYERRERHSVKFPPRTSYGCFTLLRSSHDTCNSQRSNLSCAYNCQNSGKLLASNVTEDSVTNTAKLKCLRICSTPPNICLLWYPYFFLYNLLNAFFLCCSAKFYHKNSDTGLQIYTVKNTRKICGNYFLVKPNLIGLIVKQYHYHN